MTCLWKKILLYLDSFLQPWAQNGDSYIKGKGWPLGRCLWCLIVTLSLPHWYPGSGVVLDCIDYWSLPSFLTFPTLRTYATKYFTQWNLFNTLHTVCFMHGLSIYNKKDMSLCSFFRNYIWKFSAFNQFSGHNLKSLMLS